MSRYLLDTNVFVYARGRDHPYRDPCRSVLRAARDGRIQLEGSVEVVREFAHLLLRRAVDRAQALEEAAEVRGQCRLDAFDGEVLQRALWLLGRYPDLGARDAVHAATALEAGVGRIVSVDRVFDSLTELDRIDPAAEGGTVGAPGLTWGGGQQGLPAPRCLGWPATPNRPRSWWLPERGSRRNAAFAVGAGVGGVGQDRGPTSFQPLAHDQPLRALSAMLISAMPSR